MKKIIVAHPGQQHSYKIAEALNDAGMLFKYITTVYDKKNSGLMQLLKRFLKKSEVQRANGRKTEKLEDSQVIQFCQLSGLLTLAVLRIDKTKGRVLYNRVNRWVSNSFGKKVARYAIKNNVDAVICYDANALACFSLLKKHAPDILRIMDNSAPNRYGLFLNYHELNEKYKIIDNQPDAFKKFLIDEKEALYYKREAELADKHIVASTFSKRMLTSIGIHKKNIEIVPYGFSGKKNDNNSGFVTRDKLRFLFVGEISAQKGIFNFLAAAQCLKDQAEFHAVGGGIDNLKEEYQIMILESINYHGYMLKQDLFELYSDMDVFVFPTLGDGFGFVVLEALHFGLPVICSRNSVGEDIIKDAYNGFLFDAGDSDSLIVCMEHFINNRDEVKRMQVNASKSVKYYTWTAYSNKIAICVSGFLEGENCVQ